jgi:hypothetical protein
MWPKTRELETILTLVLEIGSVRESRSYLEQVLGKGTLFCQVSWWDYRPDSVFNAATERVHPKSRA